MHHVILEVAKECGIDYDALAAALDEGRFRRTVLQQCAAGSDDEVAGSPHVFLADGTNVHNPGVTVEWAGEHGVGFPVVTKDDPSVYDDLANRAAEAST
jgi:predicted DsbA family dithiol-disulfide isomerase